MAAKYLALVTIFLAGSMSAADLPEGKGKEILLRACIGCHKADAFLEYRHTKDEYSAIVIRMGQRGATASTEELGDGGRLPDQDFSKGGRPW